MKNKHMLGKLGLLLTALIWGSGFTFSSIALKYFTTFQVIALRFTIAFVILLVINVGKLKSISKSEFIKGVTVGVILFLAYFFQTKGLEFTTTSKNSFLTAVNVVIVPFIGWLVLREKLSKNALLGALISLIGIGFTSFSGGIGQITFNFGDALSLIGAVFFGAHIFYMDHYGEGMPNWSLMLLQMGAAAALSWIAAFFLGEANIHFTQESILPILYIGVVATLVGYGLQTISQNYTTSNETAVILSTEAFFGMLTAILILGEPVMLTMIVGGILIFCGILVVDLKPLKES